MTYSELLNTPEWNNKRLEIIKRDKYRCQNCFNQKVIDNLELVPGEGLKKTVNNQILYLTKRANKYNYVSISFDIHKALKIRGGVALFFIKKSQPIINYGFSNYVAIRNFISNQTSKLVLKSTSDYATFNDWIDVKGLHVHHTYYQLDKNPWDYPTDALITLCWSCHEQLHKQEKVRVLDQVGDFISYFTPCQKCYGAGWFPEYSHIESGLCFQCRGRRFLELIQ